MQQHQEKLLTDNILVMFLINTNFAYSGFGEDYASGGFSLPPEYTPIVGSDSDYGVPESPFGKRSLAAGQFMPANESDFTLTMGAGNSVPVSHDTVAIDKKPLRPVPGSRFR